LAIRAAGYPRQTNGPQGGPFVASVLMPLSTAPA
jgi:hypothetical protein